MKRISLWRVHAVVMVTVAWALVSAVSLQAQDKKPTAKDKMQTVDYLVGTWSCAHQVGDFAGKYTTTYSKVLGDRWLQETYDFPPGQFGNASNPQTVTADVLIGYDERRDQWVRFFASSSGDFFAIRMKETGNGWGYRYLSFSGKATPEKTEPDATFTKKSDTEYVIDGPTYPENGKQVTEHHQCRKL